MLIDINYAGIVRRLRFDSSYDDFRLPFYHMMKEYSLDELKN